MALAGLLATLGYLAATRFLAKSPVGDFQHYYFAAQAVRAGENIYEAGIAWYGYLPMFAVLLTPLTYLEIGAAGAVWAGVNTVLIAAILLMGGRAMCRRLAIDARGGWLAWIMLVAALVMADKIRSELRLGQTDAIIMTAITLALLTLGKRPVMCGIALGFAGNFKYQSLGFILYLLVRRRWVEAISAVVSSVAIALGGALIWGWDKNVLYLRSATGSMAEMAGAQQDEIKGPFIFPIDWHRSVALPSALARWCNALGWSGKVHLALVAALGGAVVSLGWWMLRKRGVNLLTGRGAADDASVMLKGVVALEWAGIVVGTLAFAPQATSRHFFAVILAMTAAAALVLRAAPGVKRWPLVAGMVVFWLGSVLPPGGGDGDAAAAWWRGVGGMSWTTLVFYFSLLWVGLNHLRAVERAKAAPEGSGVARAAAM